MALPPAPREMPQLERLLVEAAKSNPKRIAFLGGGLQALIQQAVDRGETPELRRRFEAKAAELVRTGAVGFGEMTALHFSFREEHPYEAVPPDHPLFLLLADLAARYDVPIDLHIEAAVRDMAVPPRLLEISPLNPPTVRENITALERLLSSNRKARIVWAHIGWDNTGNLTTTLLRRLLQAHANLYLQLRAPVRPPLFPENQLLDGNGILRAAWLDLIRSFPERFVLGSDTFMARPGFEEGLKRTGSLLGGLPPELARKVGQENAIRIYRLRLED
ncbi:MAG: amidohydrolase family protein [Acidobacteria bacterium]|nr:amidohydrolase family protein [Acidobacteriota bacterium]